MSETKLIDIPQLLPNFVDKYLGVPTVFTLIVIFQGCFGGMGMIQTPKLSLKLLTVLYPDLCFYVQLHTQQVQIWKLLSLLLLFSLY